MLVSRLFGNNSVPLFDYTRSVRIEVLCFFFARICQLKVVLIEILLLTVQYLLVTNLLYAHHLVA